MIGTNLTQACSPPVLRYTAPMTARITRPHPWRPSRKAVADFTEVCRQAGLDRYLRMDEPTGADIERLAKLIGQSEDWQPPD